MEDAIEEADCRMYENKKKKTEMRGQDIYTIWKCEAILVMVLYGKQYHHSAVLDSVI